MSRTTILTHVRHHTALFALELVHGAPGDGETSYTGDEDAGAFWRADGYGDDHVVLWNEAGIVGLEFFHELPESSPHAAEPPPFGLLEGLPDRLRELASAAYERCGRRANTGLWQLRDASAERGRVHEPSGLALPVYARDDFGAPLPELADLPPEWVDLARRIASTSGYHMTASDTALVLQDPHDDDRAPAGVPAAAARLAELGVVWTGWEDEVERARSARAARRAPPSEADKALLQAVLDDDFAGVCAAFSRGAAIDCATLEEEFPSEPVGATPLVLALHHERDSIAELLIESGADVHRATRFGLGPLALAAEGGKPTLVKQLLARGATTKPSGSGVSPLEHLALSYREWRGNAKRYATVIELLLDAGDRPRGAGEALVELAQRGGRPDLAERLLAG